MRKAAVLVALSSTLLGAGCSGGSSGGGAPPGSSSDAPSATGASSSDVQQQASSGMPATEGSEGLVINEVGPVPVSGTFAFVEIANAQSKSASLGGLSLTNEKGVAFALPQITLPAGGLALVSFDGKSGADATTIHAPANFIARSGSVALAPSSQPDALYDHVAWGDMPLGVPLGWGGDITQTADGASIGRAPGAVNVVPWTAYATARATPGKPNGAPPVTVLVPASGAIVASDELALGFFPVPGAARYRVQIDTTDAFASPVVDATVNDAGFMPATALADGDYVWRVQAIMTDGSAADFSDAFSITIDAGARAANASPPPQKGAATASGSIAVAVIKQHKDTAMLLLESQHDSGAHAWNVAHPDLDKSDPADNANCAIASVQMINHFYGGNASQDRIGFQVRQNDVKGPEHDLNYGVGLRPAQTTAALTWALGVTPAYKEYASGDRNAFYAQYWKDMTQSIDAGRPVLTSFPGHATVVSGYSDGPSGKRITVQDPWTGTRVATLAGVTHYWILPAGAKGQNDEASIGVDTDGDGICDFDETMRFGTDPSKDTGKDTDGDLRSDFVEVWQSVFDPDPLAYVHHPGASSRMDFKHGPMELAVDFDGGGCIDGIEDTNADGKLDDKETKNFNPYDDQCITGYVETIGDTTDMGGEHTKTNIRSTFSALASQDGKMQGKVVIKYDSAVIGAGSCPETARVLGAYNADVNITIDPKTRALTFDRTSLSGTCTFSVTSPCSPPLSQSIMCVGDFDRGNTKLGEDYKLDARFDVPLPSGNSGTEYFHWSFDASKAKPNAS
jgi:hypothetical protein